MKRKQTAADRRHLARVAAMGCIVCSECLGYEGTPAVVHHVHTNFGWGRTSHLDTIPLCPTHHVAPGQSVHGMGREEFAECFGMSEAKLLEIVKERLGA
jgi:hypothetical protein